MHIDYRKVNQSLVTACNNNNGKVVSTFPLPKIQELLSRLKTVSILVPSIHVQVTTILV